MFNFDLSSLDVFNREVESKMLRQVNHTASQVISTTHVRDPKLVWPDADYSPPGRRMKAANQICSYCHGTWEGTPCPGCGSREYKNKGE